MTGLKIAPTLTLPIDAITETFALLAVRRAGKSNAAVVMAEEMYDNGLPWVAIDPKGDWWGVRAAGDGKAPGLAVLVFGGLNGDVPLEPTAGKLVADLIVEQRLTCVLDVSEMSKADMRRFLTDFALRLYQRNTEPLHVFCEEADEYIPQQVRGESASLVGAFEKLIKRGGFRGIGVTLITQRSASLNKDVLTQVGTLIPMRTPSPQDRKAIAAWVDVHDSGKEAVDDLPGLSNGEAYVFSPQWLNTLVKIQFRRRRTFDSGATPKVGGKPRPPATLAAVDLGAIKEAMAETIEKQKADDPTLLRRRIVELEREAAKTPVVPEPVVERVEVSVLTDEDRTVLYKVIGLIEGVALLAKPLHEMIAKVDNQVAATRTPTPSTRPARTPVPTRPAATRVQPSTAPAGDLTKPMQRVLDAIAWLEAIGFDQPTKIQTGFIAEYRVGKKVGGTFGNVLGQLRSEGLIDYPAAGTVTLTPAGRALATPADIDPTTEGLQGAIFARLAEPERRVLAGIVDAYPNGLSKQDAGEIAGYAVGSKVGGTFGNILGRLRSLGLVDYPAPGMVAATDVLFLGGAS